MATIDRRGATVSAADPPIGTNPNPDLAIKAPVRVATTGSNITLSGLQTIDGVALAAGDRVLVKDQTNAPTNGLYNASTGNWTRTIDANNNSQWTTGTLVNVTAGATNTGKTYQLSTAIPIILGTSNLTFALLVVASGNFIGDSGSGGAPGLVPAPPAGSAAAKFLSAAGDFEVPPTSLSFGMVRMFPAQGQGPGPWIVLDPWNNAINTVGTTTQGLQEAITAALNTGWGLIVDGFGIQGSTGTQPIFINCTTAIVIAADQIAAIDIRNCTINFTSAVTGDAITIDSQEMAKIAIHGQIVYVGTGYAVQFKPSSGTPLDHNIVVSPTSIEFHTIAAVGGSAAGCIAFDMTNGPILGNEFRFIELNGGAVGIDVINPTHNFEQNIIRATNIHRQTTAGVRVGTSATNQANLRQNLWLISGIRPNGAAAIGFDTWASNDVIIGLNVTNEEGIFATGLKLESGATNNIVINGNIIGAGSSAVADSGTGTNLMTGGAITLAGKQVTVQTGAVAAGHAATWNASGVLQDSKIALTAPATGSTLTIADGKTVTHNATTTFAGTDGKTLTVNNSLALAGTDATTITFQGTDTYVGRATTDTLTNKTLTSPVVSGGTIDNTTIGGNTPAAGTFTMLLGKAGNSSSNVRAPGTLATQLVSAATGANTTETDLQTFTLPANLFDAVGRGIRFKMWGTTGADANAKTVRVYFGTGNKIYDSTGVTSNNGSWMVMGEIYKIGANLQASWTTGIFINSWPSTDVQQNTQTESGTIVLKVTGQNGTAVASDIVCQGMTIEVLN